MVHEITPELSVKPVSVTISHDPGVAHLGWELTNHAPEPVELIESWLPHGRVRG